MKKRIILIFTVFFFFSTALVGVADESKKEAEDKNNRLFIRLKGSRWNPAAAGTANFVATDETIRVNLVLSGISKFISRPLRILTFIYPGSCENLGEAPAYELNKIKKTNDKGSDTWGTSKTIPVALHSLIEGDYALIIRSTPADGNRDLLCGDIR